nr:hypothetical protein [uncultured Glaciecola sp.]
MKKLINSEMLYGLNDAKPEPKTKLAQEQAQNLKHLSLGFLTYKILK